MTIRHNLRLSIPDNADPDRSDWNHHEILDQGDAIPTAETMLDGVPEMADSFGRTNSEADPDESPKSFYHMDKTGEQKKGLGRPSGEGNLSDEFRARVWEQVDEIDASGNRVASNSVKYVDHLFTVSPQYFRNDPNEAGAFDRDKVKEWLEGTLDDIEENFDTDNIASINLHLDESTPHLHVSTVPETEDGRLSVNDCYAPKGLRDHQTAYAENLPDEIQRGEEGSEAERLTSKEIYQQQVEELHDEVQSLRADKAELQQKIDEAGMDRVYDLADVVRDLPFGVQESFLAHPASDQNPIDQVMEERGLNFAEATMFIYNDEAVQRHLGEDLAATSGTRETKQEQFDKAIANEASGDPIFLTRCFQWFKKQIRSLKKELSRTQEKVNERLQVSDLDLTEEQAEHLRNLSDNDPEKLQDIIQEGVDRTLEADHWRGNIDYSPVSTERDVEGLPSYSRAERKRMFERGETFSSATGPVEENVADDPGTDPGTDPDPEPDHGPELI